MQSETEIIVKDTIQFIQQQFKQKLRINQMMQQSPIVNLQVTNKVFENSIRSQYLQQPHKAYNLDEQNMPTSIKIQNISNFGVHIDTSPQILSLTDAKSQNNQQNIQKHSVKSRKRALNQSKSTFRYSQTKIKQNKQQKKDKIEQVPLIQKQILKQGLMELNLNQQKNDQQLERQIEGVKKHLYIMRRYRKQNIDQERERIQKMMKRKSPQNPKSPHTYEYDGQVVKIGKLNHSTSLVQQLKQKISSSTSKNQQFRMSKNSNKKQVDLFSLTNDVMIDNNPERVSPSRQIQKTLFNNSNKRQTSHLPFINLGNNMKMTQNSKQVSNQQSTRLSLNKSKFSERSNQNTFKHFSHIELQKKQLQQSIKKSYVNSFQENDKQSQQDQNDVFIATKPQVRRQSKLMQKYLKKLGAQKLNLQKIQQEQRKSVNFDKLKVPQQFPIQRYYKYNYNNDKIQFQTELTSRKSSIITKLS